MIPFEEVLEKLKRLDEVLLLELLNINSEEIVNMFTDRIEYRYEELLKELE
jgi:hypothetical protein